MSLQDVLVVDDDPRWRRSLQGILEREGYIVTSASDRETALHALRDKYFPVVTVDLRLQGQSDDDGWRLLQDIDDLWPSPLVAKIIISGYPLSPSETEALFPALKTQSTSFISKGGDSGEGFDVDQFVSTVGLALSRLPRTAQAAAKLFRAWTDAVASLGHGHTPNFVTHVVEVAEQFEKALDLVPSARRTAFVYKNIIAVTLDCSPILADIRMPETIPFLFVRHQHLQEADVEDIRHVLISRMKSWIALVCRWTENNENVTNSYVARLRSHACTIILVSEADIETVIASEDPQVAMRRLVLSSVDLVTVSPFTTTGPTPTRLFFGRERELQELVARASTSSSAVIGGRRMGKTSILSQLHQARLPAVGYYSVFHDCSNTKTYEAFLDCQIHNWSPSPPSGVLPTFGDLFQALPLNAPVVLLLDEADKLVPKGNSEDWRLFDRLRSLANSGRSQVVLSGEHTLRDAMRNPATPLFNLANEVLLRPLNFSEVEQLVTRPMRSLEIAMVDESTIVRNIFAFTSGHPNIVQRLCSRLLVQLNEQGKRRITPDDVDSVINDHRFQEQDFLETYWDRATPLEQIISLLMAQDQQTYRLKDILDLLAARDLRPEPEIVKAALDRLVDLRSILERGQAGYEFAVTAFPRVIANTTTAEDLLIVFKSKYLKNPMELPA